MHAEDTVGPILDVFSYKAVTRRSVSKVSFRCNESSKVSEFLSAHPSSLLARSAAAAVSAQTSPIVLVTSPTRKMRVVLDKDLLLENDLPRALASGFVHHVREKNASVAAGRRWLQTTQGGPTQVPQGYYFAGCYRELFLPRAGNAGS